MHRVQIETAPADTRGFLAMLRSNVSQYCEKNKNDDVRYLLQSMPWQLVSVTVLLQRLTDYCDSEIISINGIGGLYRPSRIALLPLNIRQCILLKLLCSFEAF